MRSTSANLQQSPTFVIGSRHVGVDQPPLVLAEVGINHEGSLEKALQLVDAAALAGAEVVKFQCHITEKEMVPTDMTPGAISSEKLWDIIKRCELTALQERDVQAYCEKRGIMYLSTPFSREAADRLDEMGVPAFKIGSGECNNVPLLQHVASKGKPMILSTGMNDLSSVERSVAAIKAVGVPLALMHCTSMYPTPYENVRLGAITELRERFPQMPVGLSDHSLNIWTCLGAVALGASILEKHFTISRSWPGPDTGISIEPDELHDLIDGARAIWQARGGGKTRLREEQPVIDFAYATVVTIAPIKEGDVFSAQNTWVKRPGTGKILAASLDDVIGKKATRDIPPDVHVQPEDVDGYTGRA
ncbi:MAG TPA: N-acetylneuraminate synthase family protein [Vicinamibacterales bacterium]|nr:N-acetylneuraminate synthase family protein [Vicinamibacterales bacterium]